MGKSKNDIDFEKLEAMESMKNIVGKKDGEIKVFKNGTKAQVFVWKEEGRKWEYFGDVTDNPNQTAGGRGSNEGAGLIG